MNPNNDLKKLIDICLQNSPSFSIYLEGNHYCKLGLYGHKIDCPYFGEKDKNKMHVCKWYEEPNKKEKPLEIKLAQINLHPNMN